MKLAPRTEAGLYSVNKATAVIASIILAAMMFLTVADVVGRYFLNRPITGTWELVGLFLVCAGTWGWGYCQLKKDHISVDIILARLPWRVQAILRSVAYLIGFAVFSLMCWQMLLTTIRYISLPGGVTMTLEIPYYPFMLALTISAGLLALTIFIDLLRSLAEVARK
jgi:TRAP-type C4-dicarboxylate transport system permease small subunit